MKNDLPICFGRSCKFYSADVPISNRIEMSVSASFASVPQPQTIFTCGANSWMTVKRLHRSSKLISDSGMIAYFYNHVEVGFDVPGFQFGAELFRQDGHCTLDRN